MAAMAEDRSGKRGCGEVDARKGLLERRVAAGEAVGPVADIKGTVLLNVFPEAPLSGEATKGRGHEPRRRWMKRGRVRAGERMLLMAVWKREDNSEMKNDSRPNGG